MNTVPELITAVRQGEMVVILDDEDRENEGDLIMAAETVTPQAVNFMITHGKGLLCLPLSSVLAKQLNLKLMAFRNDSPNRTQFTVSVEAARGVSTGISAFDRAKTILTAVKKGAKPSDLISPGHLFPIVAHPKGLLKRRGHTEAACELAQLAGFRPAGVLIEILNRDGSMARGPECMRFAKKHKLKIGTIADLIEYKKISA